MSDLFALRVCNQCSSHYSVAAGNAVEDAGLPTAVLTKVSLNDRSASICPARCGGLLVALVDQIIVGDNGSTDDTARIATACGAMVVREPERGYGAACLAALAAPVPKDIIVFVDADRSVVPDELHSLISPIFDGADLVIGSRTLGHCEKGALSLPQSLGNCLASALIRLLWRSKVTDLGPFRAVDSGALATMQMSDRKFGWTVEMQIRALQLSLKTVEVPVSTRKRIGKSKISGTVRGVLGAAHGILGTIGKLYWRQITGNHAVRRENKIASHLPLDDTKKSS